MILNLGRTYYARAHQSLAGRTRPDWIAGHDVHDVRAHEDACPEPVPLFSYWLTFFAVLVCILATCFAIASIDETGIANEGRVTSVIPVALAACGVALTMRWGPERNPFAIAWLLLHIPSVIVGLKTSRSTLQQSLRREQASEDERIATQWELKQLTNRVALLEQLVRPGGPDPQAQKKLTTTGNSLEKYYTDTKDQLEKFLQRVEEDSQRTDAQNMLRTLQQMSITGQKIN